MTPQFEKLALAVGRRGACAVERHTRRLAQLPPPPGVRVEATDDGIALSGKSLRRRMLTDPNLRNFGR